MFILFSAAKYLPEQKRPRATSIRVTISQNGSIKHPTMPRKTIQTPRAAIIKSQSDPLG